MVGTFRKRPILCNAPQDASKRSHLCKMSILYQQSSTSVSKKYIMNISGPTKLYALYF